MLFVSWKRRDAAAAPAPARRWRMAFHDYESGCRIESRVTVYIKVKDDLLLIEGNRIVE